MKGTVFNKLSKFSDIIIDMGIFSELTPSSTSQIRLINKSSDL